MSDFDPGGPSDDDPLPRCYRHPGRETGVSCANCGRPICHECMTQAAIGFRCPECMAEQRRASGGRARVVTRRQTRSRWQGGMLGSGGFSVTKVLLAINLVMFVIELATGAVTLQGGSGPWLLKLGALSPFDVIVNHQYWRMVTVMFLHGSLIHILFNMWALLVIGDFVEGILGRLKFLAVYFVGGLAGSALIVVAAPRYEATVGASGAIFGIFAALAVYAFLFRRRDAMASALLGQIVFLLVLNLVFTFAASNISWQGHIGGLVGGAALMAAFTRLGSKRPGGRFDRGDIVAVLVGLALVVGVTLSQIQ